MVFSFYNLDEKTRTLMLDEIEDDCKVGRLYISDRLNTNSFQTYNSLLREAVKGGTERTLADNLYKYGCMKTYTISPKTGKPVKVPYNAHELLAEGEFNRFYIRALCTRVLKEKVGKLYVYRAKLVNNPRPYSQAKIGQVIEDPQSLLDDLRAHIGVDTALGLPNGPYSGLSVKII